MGWAGYVARIGALQGDYSVLVGRPGGKIPLGRPRSRWKDIKFILKKWNGEALTGLV
jgi:hypothetical protein